MRIGIDDERELSDRFQSILGDLGDVVAGDEKLMRFCGDSGFVRLCPNKPAKMGIWSYQACVFLANSLPYLVYTKAHLAPSALGMSVQTHSVVRDWTAIMQRFRSQALLVMDSYYLSKEGRAILNDGAWRVNFLAALKRDRFRAIDAFLAPRVTKSGDTAAAVNERRREVAVFHWSLDTNVGKKLVLSNAFTRLRGRRNKKGHLPVCDHYNSGFAGCDNFNSGLRGKTYPYITRPSRAGADLLCGWNYLVDAELERPGGSYPGVQQTQ